MPRDFESNRICICMYTPTKILSFLFYDQYYILLHFNIWDMIFCHSKTQLLTTLPHFLKKKKKKKRRSKSCHVDKDCRSCVFDSLGDNISYLFNLYMVLRHLKFINDITTYSLYCNIYIIKSIKINITIKWMFFILLGLKNIIFPSLDNPTNNF